MDSFIRDNTMASTTSTYINSNFAINSVRGNKKFAFKTTVEQNGIVLTRPAPKITKKSRDSSYKVARSKVRSKMRGMKDYLENEEEIVTYVEPRKEIYYAPYIAPQEDVPVVYWPHISEVPHQETVEINEPFATIVCLYHNWW